MFLQQVVNHITLGLPRDFKQLPEKNQKINPPPTVLSLSPGMDCTAYVYTVPERPGSYSARRHLSHGVTLTSRIPGLLCRKQGQINVLLDFLLLSAPHKQRHIATYAQRILFVSNADTLIVEQTEPRSTFIFLAKRKISQIIFFMKNHKLL